MAALLIILAACTGKVEGVLIKRYDAKHKKGGFIFTGLVSLFSMLFFILTDRNGFYFPSGIFPYGLVSGVMFCIASFTTYVALGCGPFTITMLILSYTGVSTILFGLVFLHEQASIFTYIGFALIMISLFLTRGERHRETDKKVSHKWLICVILTFVSKSAFSILMRVQQIKFENACSNEYMIITLGFSALVLLVVGIIRAGQDLPYILRYGGLYAAVSGLCNGATNLMGLAINMLMPISISSPIRTGVGIISSFILSKVIFKEKFLIRQVIGVIIGGAALIFLNF